MGNSNSPLTSITKKVIMALVGLFLISFLVVHLAINLTLLIPDSGREIFTKAAHFMGTNPVIKVFEIILIAGFITHIFIGVVLQLKNWRSRPQHYKVKSNSQLSFFSKYMIHTGVLIFIFMSLHILDFYYKAKFTDVIPMINVDGTEYHDLGFLIIEKFKSLKYLIIYLVAFVFLGFHLNHAFQSAFQSLGLNHSKYTPFIKKLGLIVSIVLPLGFTILPLVIYFSN
ncbi:MAG: succinate dehydrogenase cytochrome b subunit [Sphingobacteriia bacterium]|nr:succinate dehydrogenase cytochrome b subunit [Sphingobacteriia bacterium]